MSEEKVVETKEAVVEETKEEVVELSPVEQEAQSQGWVPKETWVEQGGDPEEWRSAKEFVARGELYKSLHQTKADLKKTQAALSALQRHHQYVFEKAHQTALNELKMQRRAAIRNDDLETAEALAEEMEQAKEQFAQEKAQLQAVQQQEMQQQVPAEFIEWRSKNLWYDSDLELRDFADAIGLVYYNRNPGSPTIKVLQHVEQEVKRKFPDKFGMKRAAPNAVGTVDRTNKRGNKANDDMELNDLEREIMTQLVRSGEMTEKEYKDQLKKAKGIK